jgi:hypothetical protein
MAQALSQDHFAVRTSMIIRIISSPHLDIARVRLISPD